MGAAASNSPPVGVALNPRVEYASKLAQAEGKVCIEAKLLRKISNVLVGKPGGKVLQMKSFQALIVK